MFGIAVAAAMRLISFMICGSRYVKALAAMGRGVRKIMIICHFSVKRRSCQADWPGKPVVNYKSIQPQRTGIHQAPGVHRVLEGGEQCLGAGLQLL